MNNTNIQKHIISLRIQENFRQCKKYKSNINFTYNGILFDICSVMKNLENNLKYSYIIKELYNMNMEKLEDIKLYLKGINIPTNIFEFNKNKYTEIMGYLYAVRNKLNELIKRAGMEKLLDTLDTISTNFNIKKFSSNNKNLLKTLNQICNVLSLTVVEFARDNDISNNYNDVYYDYLTSELIELQNYGTKLNIVLNHEKFIITIVFKQDPLNIIREYPIFKEKLDNLDFKLNALINVADNFRKRYMEQISIKNLIVEKNNKIIDDIIFSYDKFKKLKELPISLLVKQFVKGKISEQVEILTLFLISDKEDQFLAHIIYDMIANPSYLLNSQPMADKVYNSLHWSVQKLFKIAIKVAENKKNKVEFSENDIPYEKRIELLKADDYVKNKAKDKIKEANGSKENSAKAQQYLDGLLKIPFSTYKKEEVLSLTDNLKSNILNFRNLIKDNYELNDDILEKIIPNKFSNSNLENIITNLNNNIINELKLENTLTDYPEITTNISLLKKNLENLKIKKSIYLNKVEDILTKSVYGHNHAKTEIKRLIAQWMNGSMNGAVIGLHGPPGTGKTMLCKKGIANCLLDEKGDARPFAFLAVGGSTNGSILEGHSYTYMGSTWGRIADILMETKCMNPIIYIDELDKVSKTEHGREIIGILTHLTDPSQNTEFTDRYFAGIKLDLSKAIFVFSYNDAALVDRILYDRITEIKVKPLTKEDKIVICNSYLLPEIYDAVGFDKNNIIFEDDIISFIIDTYTYEAGVRKIKEKLYEIIREINLKIIMDSNFLLPFTVSVEYIKNLFSDKNKVHIKKIADKPHVGMVNGLYATSAGIGGLTIIQVLKNLSDNKLSLELTGQQGDVMKESMMCAKTLAWNLIPNETKKNITNDWKDNGNYGLHIHCPEGGTPKDGPSAGAAITVAILSRLCNISINNKVAMTGEIDLNGLVHQIGGLQSKIDGAIAAGVEKVLIPFDNSNDYKMYLKKNFESKTKTILEKDLDINELEKLNPPDVNIVIVKNIFDVIEHIFVNNNIKFNKFI